jgi:outer membrane receptor for ferrienterochelin and colicins
MLFDMKIPRLFLLICFVLPQFVFSQTEVQVVSIDNNESIPFAKIEIKTLEGTTSSIANNRGVFILPANEAFVSIKIQAYGYEVFKDSTNIQNLTIISLSPIVNEFEEIVITGQIRETTTKNAIQKIRVIDRESIDAKGAVNLKDVLQNELNIRINQDQILGSGLSFQGVSGEGVLILLDGVPIIGRMNGEIDLSQINLANIQRIELIEGPLSVAYGSHAIAGTINLISKKNLKKGQEIQLNTYYETVGNYNLDGRATINFNKHKISIYGGRNYFDGWTADEPLTVIPKSKVADSSRFQTWKPKEQFTIGLDYTYQVKNTTISPYVHFFTEKIANKGLPRAPHYMQAFDDYYYTNRSDQGFSFQTKIKTRFKIQGVFSHNYYQRIKNTYLKDLTNLTQQITLNNSDQDTSDFRVLMSRATYSQTSKSEKLNFEAGYDLNFEIARGKRIEKQAQEIGDYALFGALDWYISPKLVVKPAARIGLNSSYGPSLTPSFNVKYSLKKAVFRGSYAQGFRSPSIKELYMNFVDIKHNISGNQNLVAERSNHFQAWYTQNFKVGKSKTELEMTSFYQNVTNKISLSQDNTGTLYSYFNLDQFESVGIRAQLGWNYDYLELKVGYAYTGTKSSLGNNRFYYSPEFNAAAIFNWKKPDLKFHIYYKYTGRLESYLQSDVELQKIFMDSYNVLDFNVSRPFYKKRIIASIGVKNLLDVKNVTSSTTSGVHSSGGGSSPISWGRSGYFKVQFLFNNTK